MCSTLLEHFYSKIVVIEQDKVDEKCVTAKCVVPGLACHVYHIIGRWVLTFFVYKLHSA